MILRIIKVAICLLLLLLSADIGSALAAENVYTADATYTGGDADTPAIAEQRALDEARRRALEQAGVFIQSMTIVSNNQVTKDEVMMLTAGIVKTIIVKQSRTLNGNSIDYYARVNCTIDDAEIKRIQEQAVSNKELLKQLAAAKDDYQKIKLDNERLQAQLVHAATPQETQQISQQITVNEEQFTANQLLEKATRVLLGRQRMGVDYKSTLNLLDQALAKDGTNPSIYYYRGYVLFKQGNYPAAIDSYSKSLQINPNQREAYYFLGYAYYKNLDNINAIAFWQQYQTQGGNKPYYDQQ